MGDVDREGLPLVIKLYYIAVSLNPHGGSNCVICFLLIDVILRSSSSAPCNITASPLAVRGEALPWIQFGSTGHMKPSQRPLESHNVRCTSSSQHSEADFIEIQNTLPSQRVSIPPQHQQTSEADFGDFGD